MSKEEKVLPENNDEDLLTKVEYICRSDKLIVDALEKGYEVTQMPNGDIYVREVKVVNVQYSWDYKKGRMVRLGSIGNGRHSQ